MSGNPVERDPVVVVDLADQVGQFIFGYSSLSFIEVTFSRFFSSLRVLNIPIYNPQD